MNEKFKNFFLILLFILLSNCGFKVLDNTDINDFKIEKISSSGYSKVNFIIKKRLKDKTIGNSSNIVSINIDSKKSKIIKEKNLNKKIRKNEITIMSNFSIYFVGKNKNFEFKHSASADYLVSKNYADSLRTEKKIEKTLASTLANKIIKDINLIINDF